MAVFDPSKIVFGTSDDNILTGGAGDDVQYGLGGADLVSGGAGHDVLLGDDDDELTADGDDQLDGGDGNDILVSGHGFDTLLGGAGDDFLLGGVGVRPGTEAWSGAGQPIFEPGRWGVGDVLTIDGGAGNDRAMLNFSFTPAAVTLDLRATKAVLKADGADIGSVTAVEELHLTGGFGDDIVYGGIGSDVLYGGMGADTLGGEGGADQLDGGDGADTLSGGAAADQLFGGFGDDTLDGGSENDILFGDDGDDQLDGGSGDDALYGDAGNDRLTGGGGADSIDGGDGVDVAVFNVNASQATWTQIAGGGWRVVTADGVDTLLRVETLRFLDKDVALPQAASTPLGSGVSVNFAADPATFAGALRDYDGNDLGKPSGWKVVGQADIQNDGDIEYILVNQELGRWATIGPAQDGLVYFQNHGAAGDTRVVGVYLDPLVQSGQVQQGGPFDSQRRFANDLSTGNIGKVLGAGDFDKDGLQEIYFSLGDGTAYLHAYMHADGNIRYANYQSKEQVIDFLTANGWNASTWDGWFT